MNSKTTLSSLLPLSLIFILISSFSGFGQNKQPILVSSYKEYTELPREIAYAHLNKTTYLKGEILLYCVYFRKRKPPTLEDYHQCLLQTFG